MFGDGVDAFLVVGEAEGELDIVEGLFEAVVGFEVVVHAWVVPGVLDGEAGDACEAEDLFVGCVAADVGAGEGGEGGLDAGGG